MQELDVESGALRWLLTDLAAVERYLLYPGLKGTGRVSVPPWLGDRILMDV